LDGIVNKRMLVVDDDPGQARLISVLLRNEFDVEVDMAYSCEEARERFESGDYDLITLDYQLPDGDGLTLLEEVRRKADPPPVVIITGHGDEQTAVSAFKAGAFGYVVKDRRMSTMIVEEARSAMARAGLLETEAALLESRTRYKEIFETSSLGIITFDEHGRTEAINPACMEILGIADAADLRDVGLFVPGYVPEEEWRRIRRGESAVMTIEIDYDRIAGEGIYTPTRSGTAWLEGTITPLMRGGSDRPRGYLAQIADVTDRELKGKAIEVQRDLAMSVLSARSLQEALRLVLSAVLRATGLDGGGIYVLDESEGALRLAVHEGLSDAFVEEARYYPPEHHWVRGVTEKRLYFIGRADLQESDPIYREGLKSVAVVPLEYQEAVIGCLNVASRKLEAIDGLTREIIVSLAGQAAQAIQHEMVAEALAAERDRMVKIMDALPVGVVLIGRDGHLSSANRAAYELSKRGPEEAAGRFGPGRGWELGDWDGNPVAYEETPLGRVMATGGAVRGVRLSAVDGEGARYYVLESAAPVFDERGEIEYVVLSIEEMSDLRNAMENLAWTERIYRETAENLNEGIWVLDAGAVTTFVSDRMARMLGYTPEEMTGRAVFDFVDEENEAVLRHNLELRRQGMSQDYDLEFRHKDGHAVSTYLAAAPIRDPGGNFIGAHAGVLDITARKEAENELRDLNAELERFAHVVSHDLKGPISVLIASNHMLEGLVESITDEELRAQVAEVASLTESSATRAYNLVNDLLLLAESSQAPRRLERVSLDEVVRTVLEEKGGEIAERGVEIEFEGGLGSVVADRTHVYQLLSNLISNGLKHNDADEPVLSIKPLEKYGSRVGFSVCDNGSGIEEELRHTMFEPFSKSPGGGAGLGLSIVKKVVEIYNGSVEARNEGGACFDVTLEDYPAG